MVISQMLSFPKQTSPAPTNLTNAIADRVYVRFHLLTDQTLERIKKPFSLHKREECSLLDDFSLSFVSFQCMQREKKKQVGVEGRVEIDRSL